MSGIFEIRYPVIWVNIREIKQDGGIYASCRYLRNVWFFIRQGQVPSFIYLDQMITLS